MKLSRPPRRPPKIVEMLVAAEAACVALGYDADGRPCLDLAVTEGRARARCEDGSLKQGVCPPRLMSITIPAGHPAVAALVAADPLERFATCTFTQTWWPGTNRVRLELATDTESFVLAGDHD